MEWASCLYSRDHVQHFQNKSPSPQGVAYYWNVLHFVFQEKKEKKKSKIWDVQQFVLQCSN